jgi:hypothetical protein
MEIVRPNQVWAMDITYIPMATLTEVGPGCQFVEPLLDRGKRLVDLARQPGAGIFVNVSRADRRRLEAIILLMSPVSISPARRTQAARTAARWREP